MAHLRSLRITHVRKPTANCSKHTFTYTSQTLSKRSNSYLLLFSPLDRKYLSCLLQILLIFLFFFKYLYRTFYSPSVYYKRYNISIFRILLISTSLVLCESRLFHSYLAPLHDKQIKRSNWPILINYTILLIILDLSNPMNFYSHSR